MKYALVTGGSGVIGSAICKELAADGCFVYVHSHRSTEAAETLAEEIRNGGGQAASINFDVSDGEAVEAALAPVLESTKLQILVNNAGIHDDAVFAGMEEDQWHRVIDVSLNGFFYVTKTVLMPMLATRWGRIINISSITGIMGNKGQVNYAAAKGGLHAATKSLSREYASRGITANVVAPGMIESPSTALYNSEQVKQMVPMKRMGTAEEVASVVGFLASEKASYVTGQIIAVDGGIS